MSFSSQLFLESSHLSECYPAPLWCLLPLSWSQCFNPFSRVGPWQVTPGMSCAGPTQLQPLLCPPQHHPLLLDLSACCLGRDSRASSPRTKHRLGVQGGNGPCPLDTTSAEPSIQDKLSAPPHSLRGWNSQFSRHHPCSPHPLFPCLRLHRPQLTQHGSCGRVELSSRSKRDQRGFPGRFETQTSMRNSKSTQFFLPLCACRFITG